MISLLWRSALLLTLCAHPAGAQIARSQSFFVTGTVRAKDGTPISGAQVSIAKIGAGAASRDGGRFRFPVVDAHVHGQTEMLQVRLVGYRSDSASIRMEGDSAAHDFVLDSVPLVLGPLIITGPTQTSPEPNATGWPDGVASSAQGLVLSGRITDGKSGAPVESARVSIGNGTASIDTDADGRYALTLLSGKLNGQVDSLHVRLIGYAPASRPVTLSPGAVENNLVLARQSLVLKPTKPAPATQWVRSMASVVRSSGWPDLETGPPRNGTEEIRVWLNVGMVTPQTVYRLTRRGGKTTGDIVRYEQRTDSGTLRMLHGFVDSTCSRITIDTVYVCHLRQREGVRWSKTWDALRALHIWTIPDEADTDLTEPIMNDGADITVELWDGKHYRSWSYTTSGMFGDDRIPEKSDAGEIWHVLVNTR